MLIALTVASSDIAPWRRAEKTANAFPERRGGCLRANRDDALEIAERAGVE